MSIAAKDEFKSVVLWHMNGCIATIYEQTQDQKRKVPVDTISFTNKAYLAFHRVDELRIASPAVSYLDHLSSLLLQNNHLKTLPKELWRLNNLQELNLGNNQLETIPEQVGLLANLRELFIHNNQICRLPAQIGNLDKLVVLDVTDNRLEWLPSEVLRLSHLRNLWIENNPFTATATTQSLMVSLKDICIQTIGQLCNTDLESRRVISETCLPILDKSRLLIEKQGLVTRCFACSCILYHDHLNIIKIDDKLSVPLEYKACTQTCYLKLLVPQ